MHRKITVSLPEETLQRLDRVAGKGQRSHLIDRAIRYYLETLGKANLRQRLKEGAIRRSKRDLQLAEEWFFLEEEAWERL